LGSGRPGGPIEAASVRRVLLGILPFCGVAVTVLVLWWGYSSERFHFPGGDTFLFYDTAGDRLRAGLDPYVPTRAGDDGEMARFLYAPPWALLLAATSWLPPGMLHLASFGGGIAALRYLGGSWRGAGILCLCPLVGFELSSGNINLILAAAIALAVNGAGAIPSGLAFAKLSPAVAIDRRGLRSFTLTSAALIALTIPWLWLWPAWVDALRDMATSPVGPQLPLPFGLRLVVGLALAATRVPSLRAAGAVIATPAFYVGSLVLLLALAPSLSRSATRPGTTSPSGRHAARWRGRWMPGERAVS
jgi:hypothetical protein